MKAQTATTTITLLLVMLISSIKATKILEYNNTSPNNVEIIFNVPTWTAQFGITQLNMTMTQTETITLTITHIDPAWHDDFEFHVLAKDDQLLHVQHVITANDIAKDATVWSGNFSIEAVFLGHTEIYVELRRPNLAPERSTAQLSVIILRNTSTMDIVFRVSVACFVVILYINCGAALELDALKSILLRPIGPSIGFIGQFIVMPSLSFLIGYFLFRDMIELRLGLFFTGSSPGGGASNVFTVILGGNLNLSITMTAISNLAAFGMMPLWIFTLGALIFHDGNFAIPYKTIAIMSFSLVLPLSIGIALQKLAPDVAKKMAKLLKPISLVFIIFITIFAFTVNSYMFKLFSWKIILAGCALPWIGYCTGWLMAVACRQSNADALTIAIETGIQNTGIAIFMLNFTLPQPQADMTNVIPVAHAMMTPLPLLLIYIIRKIFYRSSIEEVEEAPSKIQKQIEVEIIMPKERATVPANKTNLK